MEGLKNKLKLYVFPGNIEEDILQIGIQQIPYMRTAQFSDLVKDSERMLLHLMGCSNGKVLFYTASGTGAMDAVVSNVVTMCQKAFVISGGAFGHRWVDLCDYYGCKNDVFEVPFACDIDYVALERALDESMPSIFLCQQHETSTGQLFDLNRIGRMCRDRKIIFVVDAISSFLSDSLNMNSMGIDICITSSQKGLNIPPGLSFVVLSERLLQSDFSHKSYYFDFHENLKNLERGQTPYSPATILFLQLYKRLQRVFDRGTTHLINEVRDKALYFRELCAENHWEVPAEVPSNCITGFFVHRNADILFTELLKQNIYIMPGGTPHYFRVSHLGLQSKNDLRELADRIKEIENR